MRYFKAQLLHTFERYESILREDIPKDFVTNLLCNSFAETVGWWICDHQDIAPDAIAAYYLKSLAGIFIEF